MSIRARTSGGLVAACLLMVCSSGPAGESKVLEPAQVVSQYERHTWRLENGLPSNRVKSILQSQDGYIWVATTLGLARFDGLKFTVFNRANTPGLAADHCDVLGEDSEHNLWIIPYCYAGVTRMREDRFEFMATPKNCTRVPRIFALCPGRLGGMLMCGEGFLGRTAGSQLVSLFDGGSALPHLAVGLDEDDSGLLWLCTETGLVSFDPASQEFHPAPLNADFDQVSALAIRRGPRGERWVAFSDNPQGTPGRGWLACFKDGRWVRGVNRGKPDFYAHWVNPFIAIDADGTLWLPGKKNGLTRFVDGSFEYVPRPFAADGDYVLSARSDRQGNLWLGTELGGLERWSPRKVTTWTTDQGLANDAVWAFCEARDGSVWIGTDDGVSHLSDGRLTNYLGGEENPTNNVRSLVEDEEGTIWVGTLRALYRIQQGKVTETRFPGGWEESKVRALFCSRDGALWVGTVRGLTRLRKGETRKFTVEDGLGSDEIRTLLEDRAGSLWVGTLGGGLSRLREGRFETLTTANGLSSNNVWALREDAEGALWIATDNGLNRFKDGQFAIFNTADGLPEDGINNFLEDDAGRFWISYDRGLYWVRRHELNELAASRLARGSTAKDAASNVAQTGNKPLLVVRYGEADGLLTSGFNGQKSQPSACRTRDGRLWFATTKGALVIDPKRAQSDDVPPAATIELFLANGETVFGNGPGDPKAPRPRGTINAGPPVLRLQPGGARVIEVRYTANTFFAPEKATFKYRLRGLDDHWIDAGTRREAHFTRLDPGEYVFEVTSRDAHGLWQEGVAAITFQLPQHFFRTWWFYAGLSCVVGGLLALIVLWRVRELRRFHDLERANALMEQRKRIARDIHDELGASLTRILQLSGKAAGNLPGTETSRSRTERIASLAEETLDHIGEIVWANNPKYDHLEDLVAYLREYAATFLKDVPVVATLDFPDSIPALPVGGMIRRHLLMLLKEALQNLLRHATAKHVCVRLSLHGCTLELEVGDDGCGFDVPEAQDRGNGLANMCERTAELSGVIDVCSEPGHGTTIRVRLPLR